MFKKAVFRVCRLSLRHPWLWLLAALAISVPAYQQVRKLSVDANSVRLLPKGGRSARLQREIGGKVGGEEYFYFLVAGADRQRLVEAVESAAVEIGRLDGIRTVSYKNPVEYFRRFQYLLLPSDYLKEARLLFLRWESQVNPLTEDLLADDSAPSYEEEKRRRTIERLMDQYGSLPEYQQSADGRTMGLTVYPEKGVSDLEETRLIFRKMKEIASRLTSRYGVWADIGGNLRYWMNNYNQLTEDLRRSGTLVLLAIILVLGLSFRSVKVIPVLFLPLIFGLIWSYALVRILVGNLNTITSFLLMVCFGVGVDFSVYLVKRFQMELGKGSRERALLRTFFSLGKSALIANLTTVSAFAVLAFSKFRGFSEFGLIAAVSLLVVLLAEMLFMPATLAAGVCLGWIKPRRARTRRIPILGPAATVVFLLVVIVAAVAGAGTVRFDYNLRTVRARVAEAALILERQQEVYATAEVPAAVYVATGLDAVDKLTAVLKERSADPRSEVGSVRSIRDLCPGDVELRERLTLIAAIQAEAQKPWVRHVKDEKLRRWVGSVRDWQRPAGRPRYEDVPPYFRDRLTAKDQSGDFFVIVESRSNQWDGKKDLALLEEIDGLHLPPGAKGPVGEPLAFGEIIQLITAEGPWLVVFALLSVLVIIFINQRSAAQTFWVVFPLLGGFSLTLGVMALLHIKLNYFNIVAFPSLIGMGDDYGVYYYRRWRELRGNVQATQHDSGGVDVDLGDDDHPGLLRDGLRPPLGAQFVGNGGLPRAFSHLDDVTDLAPRRTPAFLAEDGLTRERTPPASPCPSKIAVLEYARIHRDEISSRGEAS